MQTCKFKETRRIVGALHQRITYNEWLPTIIGDTLMSSYGLTDVDGYNTDYDDQCDIGISTEFSTAALRFGHSLVNDKFIYFNSRSNRRQVHNLTGNYFNPDFLYADNTNAMRLLHGMAIEGPDGQLVWKLDR